MPFSFTKKDRLKKKDVIKELFNQGFCFFYFPFKIYYLPVSFKDKSLLKTAVVVSKKTHPSSVSRNKIKRNIKEAFRLNKETLLKGLSDSYALVIVYIAKGILPQKVVSEKIKVTFSRFISKKNVVN